MIDLLLHHWRNNVWLRRALFAIGLLVFVPYGVRRGIDYKDVMLVAGAVIAGLILFGRERGIQFGFVLWTLSTALGYRTFEVVKGLRIHPAEVILLLLLVCILAHRQWLSESRVSIPMWVSLSLPFWALAWWPLINGEAHWADMFSEFRSFLMFIPLLVVTQIVIKDARQWRYVLLAFFAASTWIALMGVLEYWVPSVTQLFPAFISNAKAEATADGFVRAQFSFWGNQSATFICALCYPLCVILYSWWRTFMWRLVIVVATILQLVAIYIGGFRSVWLMVVLQVAAGCFFGLRKRGLAVAVLCVLVAAVGYQFIPKTDERVVTTIAALRMDPVDHSARVRKERALGAIDDVIKNPFGGGWNSAGWVHSDFLQVAANLGIMAALIFVGGYLYTFWKLAITVRAVARSGFTDMGELGFSLMLSFIAVGGLLATQGVQVLPQLMLPVWFIWALIEVWLRQRPVVPEFSYTYARPHLHPVADF
jgi:hypothetical protein